MKYHITYKINFHPEGLNKEEVPKDHGACSAVVVGSLLYPEDGSYSSLTYSADGRSKDHTSLDDAELWKFWTMMAKNLSESPTLSTNKKELCSMVFDLVTKAVLSASSKVN